MEPLSTIFRDVSGKTSQTIRRNEEPRMVRNQKIQCQPSLLVMIPPSRGPIVGPVLAATMAAPSIAPRSEGMATSARTP